MRMPILTTSIQHSIRSPRRSNREEKEIKAIQIGKEEMKQSIFKEESIPVILKLFQNIKEGTVQNHFTGPAFS